VTELGRLDERAVHAHVLHEHGQPKFIRQPVKRSAAQGVEQALILEFFRQLTLGGFLFHILPAQQGRQGVQPLDDLTHPWKAAQARRFEGKQVGGGHGQQVERLRVVGDHLVRLLAHQAAGLVDDGDGVSFLTPGMAQRRQGVFGGP